MPWKNIPGSFTRISAGSVTNVWGVSSAASGNIFRYTGDDDSVPGPWVEIPGALTDVGILPLTDIGAAADGTVWGVNSIGEVFRYTWDSNHWTKITGNLKRISVGSRTIVWGVNSDNNVFRYTGNDSNPWEQIPGPTTSGGLSDIGVGADGTVWGVNSAGNIFRYIPQTNSWTNISGALNAIDVGLKTNVWGVSGIDQKIFTYTGDDTNPWVQIYGNAPDISNRPYLQCVFFSSESTFGLFRPTKISRFLPLLRIYGEVRKSSFWRLQICSNRAEIPGRSGLETVDQFVFRNT
ncbi:hypothetical protein L218DRAFT_988522 [Marasmius fiardii PR-910]|nr:hypothetical protein L218DRAFT_988522 [Marasmius fiardii PR-910]